VKAVDRQLRARPESCATFPHIYPGFRIERMEEKRKHPRTEIEEPAYVSSGGSVMRCVVRNISPEGAAIDVENPAFVPQRFRLVMASPVTWANSELSNHYKYVESLKEF
jgi:PilZ domain